MRKSFIAILCGLALAWSATLQASALGKVFKRVSGSVVVILTEEKVLPPDTYEGKKVSAQGLGSGVLISKDGKVLTAAHVVQTADTVSVEFPNGEIVKANVVSSEPPADVACYNSNGYRPAPSWQSLATPARSRSRMKYLSSARPMGSVTR